MTARLARRELPRQLALLDDRFGPGGCTQEEGWSWKNRKDHEPKDLPCPTVSDLLNGGMPDLKDWAACQVEKF